MSEHSENKIVVDNKGDGHSGSSNQAKLEPNKKLQDFSYDKKFHADSHIEEVVNHALHETNSQPRKVTKEEILHSKASFDGQHDLEVISEKKKELNITRPSDFSEEDKQRAGIARENDTFKRKLSNENNQ